MELLKQHAPLLLLPLLCRSGLSSFQREIVKPVTDSSTLCAQIVLMLQRVLVCVVCLDPTSADSESIRTGIGGAVSLLNLFVLSAIPLWSLAGRPSAVRGLG